MLPHQDDDDAVEFVLAAAAMTPTDHKYRFLDDDIYTRIGRVKVRR